MSGAAAAGEWGPGPGEGEGSPGLPGIVDAEQTVKAVWAEAANWAEEFGTLALSPGRPLFAWEFQDEENIKRGFSEGNK